MKTIIEEAIERALTQIEDQAVRYSESVDDGVLDRPKAREILHRELSLVLATDSRCSPTEHNERGN